MSSLGGEEVKSKQIKSEQIKSKQTKSNQNKSTTDNDATMKDSLTPVAGARAADGYPGQRIVTGQRTYVRDDRGNWWTSYIDEDGYRHISNTGIYMGGGEFWHPYEDDN